ncbi:hypothetical protein VCSRO12_2241 [Vibrio cholerae]|nr:hypothetical protein VCSRO62_0146 [Vibrio cholerae]GHY08199.1 hypothetical protein VCSRO112_1880 [Vibrio cholerae]GHY65817.1 hypothetical protein VCSRO12_2241 [Vibrio cholerae]
MGVNSVSSLKSKISLILIISIISIFVFKPFLNGLGCNFVHIFESERYIQKDQCKFGVMTVQTKDKLTGDYSILKIIWGFWGDFSFELLLSSYFNVNETNFDNKIILYESHRLVSGHKAFSHCSMDCYWVYDEPFEAFYTIERRGKLGFIN